MLPTSKYIYESLTNTIIWTKSEHRISVKPNLNRNHDHFMSTIPGRWDENLGIFSMLALLRKMRLSFADKNKIAVQQLQIADKNITPLSFFLSDC